MSSYSASQFSSDLRVTLRMAAIYSMLALIGFSLLGLLVLTGKPVKGQSAPTIAIVLGTLGVFVLVYFVGAITSACAVFLLRPLRSSWVGWALTGGLVSLSCYGALFGLLSLFGPTVDWLLALRGGAAPDPADFGPFAFLLLALIVVPVGAVFGVYWRDNPS